MASKPVPKATPSTEDLLKNVQVGHTANGDAYTVMQTQTTDIYGNTVPATTPIYVIVDEKGVVHPMTNEGDAAKATQTLLEKAGFTGDKLWNKLYESGVISKKVYADKFPSDLKGGLLQYAINAGAATLSKEKAGSRTPLASWVAPKGVGADGTKTGNSLNNSSSSTTDHSIDSKVDTSTGITKTTSHNIDVNTINKNQVDTQLTTQADASTELDAFYQEMLGRTATDAEKSDYLLQLNNEEKSAAARTNTTGTLTTATDSTGQSTTNDKTTSSATSDSATTSSSQTASGSTTTTTGDNQTSASGDTTTGNRSTTGKTTSKSSSKGTRIDTSKSSSSTTGTTAQTTTGDGLQPADRTRIMGGLLLNTIKGLTADDIIKGNGLISQQAATLKQYASNYGLNYDMPSIVTDLTQNLMNGGVLLNPNLEAQKNKIQQISKGFYQNLAPLIDSGVSIRDIHNQFASIYGNVLEINPYAVDIQDPLIQKALHNSDGKGGAMNLDDFTRLLRSDPRWGNTQNAREEGSSYLNSILKDFGLVA